MSQDVAYINNEDVEKRTITEHYFDCPHCSEEINDLEHGISDEMECPHCYKIIIIGKPSYTLKNGKKYESIGLQDPMTEQEINDLVEQEKKRQIVQRRDAHHCKTPAFLLDGEGGTIIVKETIESCPDCNENAKQRGSYVHEGTKNEELKKLGIGASVKHYYTKCDACGLELGG